jgi:Vacuolar protein sorting-associated protein 26
MPHARAARELAPAGDIRGDSTFSFNFQSVDMSMDSYRGSTVRLRYLLRVTVARGMGGLSEDFPLWVVNSCAEMPPPEQIKARPSFTQSAFVMHTCSTRTSCSTGWASCVASARDIPKAHA